MDSTIFPNDTLDRIKYFNIFISDSGQKGELSEMKFEDVYKPLDWIRRYCKIKLSNVKHQDIFTFIIFSVILFPAILWGKGSGISGKVMDIETGNLLFGANVFLVGTNLGDVTNSMGYFTIKNVPKGVYKLQASMIGYENKFVSLSVSEDSLIQIKIALKPEPIESEGVVVTGRRSMIDVEESATHIHINLLEIQKIPVSTITDFLSREAGVIELKGKLYVRGGRPGESAFRLDGSLLQDPYDYSLDVLIPEYSIRELTFYRGGFGTEYGGAQSGIIDISTRGGLSGPSFKAMIMTNDLRGKSEPIQDFLDQEPYKEHFNRLNLRMGGIIPQMGLPGNKIAFFTAGEFRAENGRMGDDYDSTFSIFGKLTYLISNNTTLRFNGIFSNSSFHNYPARWKKLHTHCPYTTKQTEDYNFILERLLRKNSLAHFQIEHHSTFERSNVFEDGWVDINGDGIANPNPYDSIIVNEDTKDTISYPSDIDGIDDFSDYNNDGLMEINGKDSKLRWKDLEFWSYPPIIETDTAGFPWGFVIKGYYPMLWSYRKSTFDLLRANLLFKIYKVHELKTGVNFKSTKLLMYDCRVSPYELGGYIQDKMDFKSLKIMAGLRYDYFNPNVNDGKSASQFSPRLGLSFLITERDVAHVTYGHYFQIPALKYFYENPLFYPYIGNPELGYEHTATYELGVTHYLANNLYTDMTVYDKDITGLVGLQNYPVSHEFYYLNSDYARARGIEIVLRKEPGGEFKYLSGIINFTYSSAVGKNSFKLRNPEETWGNYEREFPEFPLDWDERIRVTSHLILSVPKNENLLSPGFLSNFSLGIIIEYGSGLPYTSTNYQGRVVKINDKRLPSRFQVDMRLRKNFVFKKASFELFSDIQNLLNSREPLEKAYAGFENPAGPFNDPTVWQRARHIRLGLGVNF